MENINLALTLLLAGFIVVFMVLVLLIVIITVYGKLIQSVQKRSQKHREKKEKKVVKLDAPGKPVPPSSVYIPKQDDDDGEIPGEIIAAIAAAVDTIYGGRPHRIKSVKRSRGSRSAWGNTGVMQNTRPF